MKQIKENKTKIFLKDNLFARMSVILNYWGLWVKVDPLVATVQILHFSNKCSLVRFLSHQTTIHPQQRRTKTTIARPKEWEETKTYRIHCNLHSQQETLRLRAATVMVVCWRVYKWRFVLFSISIIFNCSISPLSPVSLQTALLWPKTYKIEL